MKRVLWPSDCDLAVSRLTEAQEHFAKYYSALKLDRGKSGQFVLDTKETEESLALRQWINLNISEIAELLGQALAYPTIEAPHKVGARVDALVNFPVIQRYEKSAHLIILDSFERAIGYYSFEQKRSISRIRNPLFWLDYLIRTILGIPFYLLRAIGIPEKYKGTWIEPTVNIATAIAALIAAYAAFSRQ